ncbi:MAG: hypothetical protein RJB37_3505 [Pseudomonadota bacterium]
MPVTSRSTRRGWRIVAEVVGSVMVVSLEG